MKIVHNGCSDKKFDIEAAPEYKQHSCDSKKTANVLV